MKNHLAKDLIILAIESSCDETAIAVLKDGRKVLSSQIASQLEHNAFGGVIPEIAAREHLNKIFPLYDQALKEAGISYQDIDAIGVTQGPGLIGPLLVGSSFAKGLASALHKPLIPVNHVHAHVHGAFLGISDLETSLFPCLAFVVSGGHTHLYSMKSPTSFKLLAYSIDDACGESFDKVAKLLGLSYPGGPKIEALARMGRPNKVAMPRMMDVRDRLAFSYSGLKTHIRYLLEKEKDHLNPERIQDICYAFQKEAFDQIFRKLESALDLHPETQSIVVSGGVAANQYFRTQMREKFPMPAYFPDLKYCSDNAAMIAALAYAQFMDSDNKDRFMNYEWEAFSRYEDYNSHG